MSADVFDEYGNPWKVKGGDPGSRLVSRLGRANYRLLVLPLVSLATGVVTEPAIWPVDPVRRVRMADCLEVLKSS